jgi:hypothetical protein
MNSVHSLLPSLAKAVGSARVPVIPGRVGQCVSSGWR